MTSGGRRRSTSWLVTLAACLLGTPAVFACPVCFQIEDGPIAAGVRTAVLLMIGVTVIVLTAAASFVVRFARRAARLDGEERG